MGHIVEFPSNGSTGRGYFAPVAGGGPGVLVVQEWWGLVPHIEAVCDRFAAAGFSALAPDLYGGVTTTEPDEAGKLMMALNLDQAARDFSSGIDFLLGSDTVTSAGVGVIGFCMGGGLALTVACQRPDVVRACAVLRHLPVAALRTRLDEVGSTRPRPLCRQRRHVRAGGRR